MRRLINFLVIIHTVLGQPNAELGGNEASGESIDSPKDIAEQEFNSCKSMWARQAEEMQETGGLHAGPYLLNGRLLMGTTVCWDLSTRKESVKEE